MALELLQSNKRILIKLISTMKTNQPSAYIALNNNRLKAYADVIYLKDGDEFQIELFNPYQVSVLAKIYINNSLISTSGLVFRPGQRYFLDRFIDTNKKFKFNTYTVDSGTTPEVLKAIENNGSVKVEFYK
jgi:predicted component of type VI protein secretion system